MAMHLTARMAWHDNNWNGRVCQDPEKNVYCSGTHSLLSERIARNKKIEKETQGGKIDKLQDYLPPCYWTSNAFSSEACEVIHEHPFHDISVPSIHENLASYSIFSWPFKLSFNHSSEKKGREGTYPPDLERRIDVFLEKFKEKESIVFYYLNYDNPISADDGKYLLVGCSLLKGKGKKTHFDFSEDKLRDKRSSSKNMKNFSVVNWALQFNLDYPENGVLLPYKEYLNHIEENPKHYLLLDKMKVLITEDSLISSFKYVAMDIDDDKALYLLYKLKKSISIIQEHDREYGFLKNDFKKEEETLTRLIGQTWKNRGLYPSLKHVLDLLAETNKKEKTGEKIISIVKENLDSDQDLLKFIFDLIEDEDEKLPDFLDKFTDYFDDIRGNIEDNDYSEDEIDLLMKLCLFNLTREQIERIFSGDKNSFKKHFDHSEIVFNPYLLCENYVPLDSDELLDEPDLVDERIDVFKIDIGMMPDRKYFKRNRELQNLRPISPERLRALIISYLKDITQYGDCYRKLDDIYNFITQFPLFYKDSELLHIKKGKLITEKYKGHFHKRLKFIQNNDEWFVYLNEVYRAEEIIKETVIKLLERSDHKFNVPNLAGFVEKEKDELKGKIGDFESGLFIKERTKLLENVWKKSFYILTGRPGSGKTHVLSKIVEELENRGEDVTLLAPTGKAALRLKEKVDGRETSTIDRFIYRKGYSKFLVDLENIILQKGKEKIVLDNLIIDESSMIDLQKLATLFTMVDMEKYPIKRIILVGDEYQLPPIGFGKPFYDIVKCLQSYKNYREQNYIKLLTNCRQENDSKILELAEVYAEKNRYFDERVEEVSKGGQISKGLKSVLWKNIDELLEKLKNELEQLFEENEEKFPKGTSKDNNVRLNILFGLAPNGLVKPKPNVDFKSQLKLYDFQILSPYRAGGYGTLRINEYIHTNYREETPDDKIYHRTSPFYHSDKIICIKNIYSDHLKDLILSNGSIGIVNNDRYNKRNYYFRDRDQPLKYIKTEYFELAYAITVHKSQGSDFKTVFLIIPNKKSLLSKELLYTALTRSTEKVVLFLQKNEKEYNLYAAKNISLVLPRNTSIFESPINSKLLYEPERGISVKSKAEYIVYTHLKEAKEKGIIKDFNYEKILPLEGRSFDIKPDFTIYMPNGKQYFWEHLGMLDLSYYSKKWTERRGYYENEGLLDSLITTDDLDGINKEIVAKIIDDMKAEKLFDTPENKFSKHHYCLISG